MRSSSACFTSATLSCGTAYPLVEWHLRTAFSCAEESDTRGVHG